MNDNAYKGITYNYFVYNINKFTLLVMNFTQMDFTYNRLYL